MAFGLTNNNAINHDLYKCLSTDTKPTSNIRVGSYCFETDTTTLYVFDSSAWVLASTYGVTESGANGFDVTDYGATGDGTTDDTAAIQAAADTLAGVGGVLFFPPGNYLITDTITFDEGIQFGSWPNISGTVNGLYGVTVQGSGVGATEIIMSTAGKPAFIFERSVADGQEYNYINCEGFSLIGPGIDNSATLGIQFGGGSNRTILENTRLHRVYLRNFSSCVAVDDCTNFELSNSQFDGFKFGVEMGFNIDIFAARHCGFGSLTLPQDRACTITNGSAVVAGLFDMDEDVAVGITVVHPDFLRGTTILSIDSPTQITLTNNCTGVTGASTISFVLGTAISFGKGPFDPAWNPGSAANAANAHVYQSCWFMKLVEPIAFTDGKNSNNNIKFQESYFERCNRLASMELSTVGTGPNFLIWDNCHVSQPQNFQDYAIYEDYSAAGSGTTIIRNTRGDGNSPVPWVRLDSANSKLDWDNNILNVSSGDKIHIFDSTNGYSANAGDKFVYGLSGLNASPLEQGTTGTISPRPTAKADCKIKIGPMTGNVTISNMAGGIKNGLVEGHSIQLIFEQDSTGSRTVTWGTDYIGLDGLQLDGATANFTQSAGGDEFCIMGFMWDGTRMLQTSAANVWL